jgi:hypothetical protein
VIYVTNFIKTGSGIQKWDFSHGEYTSLNNSGCYVRRRVSKEVINESKTSVMDVIGFLCVSQSSSRIQLNDSLGSIRACLYSEAGFSNQNGDRA